jgi:hypothetical protein
MKDQIDLRLATAVVRAHKLADELWEKLINWAFLIGNSLRNERGDVPGWVLVVLMTTGLVTGIWTLAAPRIDSILRNSLDSMNGIR